MRRFDPPWEFLRTASVSTLGHFELSRLNHAANLRREIATLLDEWLEESVSALLARWLMDHQDLLQRDVGEPPPEVESLVPKLLDPIARSLPRPRRLLPGRQLCKRHSTVA